jgi:Transglycosylase-like domain
VRRKLFVFVAVATLTAVPAALAATAEESAAPTKLTAFKPFSKEDVRAFKKAQQRRAQARERREARRLQRQYASVSVPPQLESIAACESGGDPSAVSADGTYRGKYQFSYATWAGVGGSGDPAAAPEAEQDYRAALLYNRSGPGQWPVCGS